MIHLSNDSRPVLIGRPLLLLNLLVVAATTVSGLIALAAPTALSHTDAGGGTGYYAGLYAARAVPLGVALAVALLVPRLRTPGILTVVLVVAGLAQVGDLVIAVASGIPGMMAGASLAAIIHLATAWRVRPRAGTHA